MGPGAVIGLASNVIGGFIKESQAKKMAGEAKKERLRLSKKLDSLEKNRQDIVSPYESVTNLSSMISNPFANLGVATGAAEIKIQEADSSLANTLDLIRATGSSAGGATALAQAALRSKKDVAAGIEQQEKSNQDKAAAGEQRAQQQRIAEEQRMQQADVSGKQFVFNQTEARQTKELDRVESLLDFATAQENQAEAQAMSALTDTVSSLGSLIPQTAPASQPPTN